MTRPTHHRTRDHRGEDTSDHILLSGDIGDFEEGAPLNDVLTAALIANENQYHLEVVMHDFGSGREPVTDADGDWLYARFPGGI